MMKIKHVMVSIAILLFADQGLADFHIRGLANVSPFPVVQEIYRL